MKRNNKFYQEKTFSTKPKLHGQSRTVTNRSACQIRTTPVPTVGDGNISRGTGAAQTTIEIFTFAD